MVLFSWVLMPFGFLLDMIAIALAMPGANMKIIWGPIAGLVVGLVGVGVILTGRYLRRQGMRHLSEVTTVDEVLAMPAFVLYLRSFTDDPRLTKPKLDSAGSRLYRSRDWGSAQGVRTEEEQLRVAVTPFGRMVAVGDPDEGLPAVGARRLYLKHNNWKESVLRLMAAADKTGLVLMGAGLSASLKWEFDQAVRTMTNPERLVLVVALNPEDYERFRQGVGRVFPKPLPVYPESPTVLKYRARIRGAIYFDHDWTAHFIRFDTFESPGNFQRVIESKFVFGMRPVYDRLKVKWPGFGVPLTTYARITRRQIPLFSVVFLVGVLILVGFVRFLLNGGSG
jgi:hypothetical protein